MSEHTPPWSQLTKKYPLPRRQHDDLEGGKKEVFRFGDWSIYDVTPQGWVTNANWNSYILHCRAWKEWKTVQRPPATTWLKDAFTENTSSHYKIEVAQRCNANMTAETNSHCPECGIKIPDEVVALWKLQNFDKIQEFNSG